VVDDAIPEEVGPDDAGLEHVGPAATQPAGQGLPERGDEPYQSLYRRYRPQRFAEVRGQEHITRALLNSVREGRVAHAYLFSGPRGTGKTSTARILAMALNCERPVDGEPCGTCASCVAIRQGSSLDVHELDAASNRKLDEMRDLLSRVALGTSGRWKVYIVDEVHQLTSDAASALLKTLEEPPGHVIFVLATTDPQKVMPTIRSRTQHFEFRLLGSDVLAGLLGDINAQAGLGVAPEAIDLVVRRGHGSARDALSVLDQVAAAGTVEDETAVVSDIVEALADRDVGRVLVAVAECMSAGRDPRRLAVDLLDHLRNGFLASQARGLVLLPDDAADEVEGQARRLGLATLVRAMEVIGQAATDMRDSVDPRVALEVALVRVASPAADHQPAALLARIEQLEQRLSEGALAAGAARSGTAPKSPMNPPVAADAAPALAVDPVVTPVVEGTPGPVGEPTPVLRAGGGSQNSGGSENNGRDAAPAGGTVPRDRPTRPPVAPPRTRPTVGDPPPTPRPTLARNRGGPGSAPDPAAPGLRPVPGPGEPAGGAVGATGSEDPAASSRPPSVAGAVRASGGAATGELPTRDELTKAWGDVVLPSLPTRIKAYLTLGRFVGIEGGAAVYALPDNGLLSRAELVRKDFEAALAAHFGRPVPVRLVLDEPSTTPSGSPVTRPLPDQPPPPEAAEEDDPANYVLAEMEDAGAAVMSPEQRLLDAFPGAEEVTP
jgi:DNA polymerase III subunit gamma/tau